MQAENTVLFINPVRCKRSGHREREIIKICEDADGNVLQKGDVCFNPCNGTVADI